MPSNNIELTLDARKLEKKIDLIVETKVKNLWLLKLSIIFFKIGAWIGGFSIEVEFDDESLS